MVKKNKKISWRETLTGFGFLLPNFLGFLCFTSLPVLASLLLAFTDWDILTPVSQIKFVGFQNFIKLLGFHREAGAIIANDPQFWYYLFNTVFLMMAIPIGMVLSLCGAMLMKQKLRGIVFYRTIFFLPAITSGVATCLVWRWIYNPDFGLLNTFLGSIGIRGPAWLSSTTWAKPALIIMGLWAAMGGYNMILYLAALQGVSQELYEAADIDGASRWQKFRHVTWPMITPTTFFIFIMAVIGGFQGAFMAAYIMTGGGPAGATTTMSYFIYNNAFQWFKMGYAASIAWFLFILVFFATLINWKYGGKLVHY
jgi:multiple sugar transport system permease protein